MADVTIDAMYDTAHNAWIFLDGLSEADLKNVTNLMMAANMAQSNVSSAYYDGIIDGLLWKKFGVCPTCDVAHEPEDHSYFEAAIEKRIAAYARSSARSSSTEQVSPTPQLGSTAPSYSGTYL